MHIPFAYVGPGAGFAFLGSFFSILLSLLAGIASLLLWPLRAILRMFRSGKNADARVIVLGVDDLDAEPSALPNLAKLGREGSYRRLRAAHPGGWATPRFWKILSEHAVDSTALLVPGMRPGIDFRGRFLCRAADGRLTSQPSYYAGYLGRLLGPLTDDQEALFFSALDHQKRGLLACALETKNAESVDRIVGRLLQSLDRNTTLFILFGQSAVFSNRELDANMDATEHVAPAVLRIFGFA